MDGMTIFTTLPIDEFVDNYYEKYQEIQSVPYEFAKVNIIKADGSDYMMRYFPLTSDDLKEELKNIGGTTGEQLKMADFAVDAIPIKRISFDIETSSPFVIRLAKTDVTYYYQTIVLKDNSLESNYVSYSFDANQKTVTFDIPTTIDKDGAITYKTFYSFNIVTNDNSAFTISNLKLTIPLNSGDFYRQGRYNDSQLVS